MAELTETNWKAVVDDLRSDIVDTDEIAVDPNVHLKNIDSLIEFHTKVLDPNTRALDERVKELNRILIAALESDNAHFVELTFRGIDYAQEKLEELFPELKEKLKESEDG